MERVIIVSRFKLAAQLLKGTMTRLQPVHRNVTGYAR